MQTEYSDIEQTRLLAEKMGGVTILRKGHVDIISNGCQCELMVSLAPPLVHSCLCSCDV